LALGSWLSLSYLLGIYFRNFAHYDLVYGTLGAFVVFMTWFYWALFALLVGAELNAEVAKESREGPLAPKIPGEEQAGKNQRRAA
jgi:membrane protein